MRHIKNVHFRKRWQHMWHVARQSDSDSTNLRIFPHVFIAMQGEDVHQRPAASGHHGLVSLVQIALHGHVVFELAADYQHRRVQPQAFLDEHCQVREPGVVVPAEAERSQR